MFFGDSFEFGNWVASKTEPSGKIVGKRGVRATIPIVNTFTIVNVLTISESGTRDIPKRKRAR